MLLHRTECNLGNFFPNFSIISNVFLEPCIIRKILKNRLICNIYIYIVFILIETPIIPCRDLCPSKFCMIGTICKFNNITCRSECVREYISFLQKQLYFCQPWNRLFRFHYQQSKSIQKFYCVISTVEL